MGCLVSNYLICENQQPLHKSDILKQNYSSILTKDVCGHVHMIPLQLIARGQLTDPGVNFASVLGVTPVTVHMSFSLPWGNFERRVTRCTTSDNPPPPPCRGNFSSCEQNAKVAPEQE